MVVIISIVKLNITADLNFCAGVYMNENDDFEELENHVKNIDNESEACSIDGDGIKIDSSFGMLYHLNESLGSVQEIKVIRSDDGNDLISRTDVTKFIVDFLNRTQRIVNGLSKELLDSESKVISQKDLLSCMTDMRSLLKMNVQSQKEVLTHSETADYFGISNDTLSQWVQDGRIAYSKVGGKNSFFLLSDILQTVKDNSQINPIKKTDRQRIKDMLS